MSNEASISPLKAAMKHACEWTAIIAVTVIAWIALSAVLDHIIN